MWFVTLFSNVNPKFPFGAEYGKAKMIGFFNNYENVEKVLNSNISDIRGNLYNYAVAERYEEGLNQEAKEEVWFKFKPVVGGYFEINKPRFVEDKNFAI